MPASWLAVQQFLEWDCGSCRFCCGSRATFFPTLLEPAACPGSDFVGNPESGSIGLSDVRKRRTRRRE